MRNLILFTLSVVILVFGGAYFWYSTSLKPVTSNENFHSVVIPKGTSGAKVARKLYEDKIIKNPLVFRIYLKLSGTENQLRAGQFKVSSNWTVQKMVEQLTKGGFEGLWVTLLEGWRREQIGLAFANSQLESFDLTEFLQLTDGQEGYLFPDTYLVPKTANTSTIVSLLKNTFNEKTAPLRNNPTTIPSQLTFEQAIIMASILEREAARDEDLPIVAGVLIKRYLNDWPIQADATLQYAKITNQLQANSYKLTAIKDWWPTPLAADKDIVSPYNTYAHPGLPPAPIANPGLATIQAVLNPRNTTYWYYITDNQGSMHYAETLEEHNRNIDRYLR